jgi:hypothetical protein
VIDDIVALFGFFIISYRQYVSDKSHRDVFIRSFVHGVKVELMGPDEVPLSKRMTLKVKGKNIAFQADIRRKYISPSVMYALNVTPKPWYVGFDDADYHIDLIGYAGQKNKEGLMKINANISQDFYPVKVRPYSDPWE